MSPSAIITRATRSLIGGAPVALVGSQTALGSAGGPPAWNGGVWVTVGYESWTVLSRPCVAVRNTRDTSGAIVRVSPKLGKGARHRRTSARHACTDTQCTVEKMWQRNLCAANGSTPSRCEAAPLLQRSMWWRLRGARGRN